jgi:hypothetical protein
VIDKGIEALDSRLAQFFTGSSRMGRSERRHWARVYIAGLLSKSELALELIDQAYGNDFLFRAALCGRGLAYAVAVETWTKVWLQEPHIESA